MTNKFNFKNLHDLYTDQLEQVFYTACKDGNVDIINYIFHSSLVKHIDIHNYGEKALEMACSNGHLNVVIFLLEGKGFNPPTNEDECNGLLYASKENFHHICQYLIMDKKIKINYTIQNQLKIYPEIYQMYLTRNLMTKLDETLDKKIVNYSQNNNLPKIKI